MIELLIGAAVAAGVGRYIIKGYSATGVLMVGGLLLLGISALMGKTLLPSGAASTGWRATDMIEYVKILLMSRGGDLGMMIMMLCGFAAYMTHIGANDVVVKLASRPIADDQFALSADGGGLFCRLPDVIGGFFRDWTRRIADGDAVPIDGERWH
ncbi:C4-dicarboxylate transporter DcuC [Serratia marcescens]|uniref:C4-dicarboxylate transporter DcuC n=1 Tax=Serratia marcescens TaxID=615 RepID=A0A380AA05_SERMA|nr:C4-dicarboxylate transporter DcuC [Serratia marcescens]